MNLPTKWFTKSPLVRLAQFLGRWVDQLSRGRAFFMLLHLSYFENTGMVLSGLIVGEKPNLFASHKHFFPSYC